MKSEITETYENDCIWYSDVTRVEHSYLKHIKGFLLKVVVLEVYISEERNVSIYEPFKE